VHDPLRGSPRRLRLLVLAVGGAGAACILIAALSLRGAHSVSDSRLMLAATLVAAGDLAVLHLRFGGERYSFTWSEAAFVLGVVLVPFPYLVLVAPLSVAAIHALSRRHPVKLVYNVMATAVATAFGRLATAAVYGHLSLAGVRGWRWWVALVVGATVFSAFNCVGTAAAVAFSQDVAVPTVIRRGLGITIGVLVGNTLVALLLVDVQWNLATVAMMPLLVALLYTAYRGYLTAREDRDVWRELEDASKEISDLDADVVAAVTVDRVLRLARADGAELLVRTGDGTAADRYHRDADGNLVSERCDATILDLMDLESGILVHSSQSGAIGSAAAVHMMTMQLDNPENGQALGALRLRFRGDVRLTDRERQVLVTFGRSVATSLYNARLYESMREAASVHEHEATHDALTGLPNRTLLCRRASEHLAEPGERPLALLLVDLDHFKSINDTLGHPTGDRLLQAAARRLRGILRRTDTIARLGGDEFAILLPGHASQDEADAVAAAVIAALATPVTIDGLRLSVEGSVGVSYYPDDASTVDELLAHADIALYQAKISRGSFRRYSRDRDDSSVSRLTLAAELRGALARDELVLHFQPQHRVAGGELVGAEALVRWAHPQRGLLPPSEFIDVAEDSGLAHEFTLHVLSKAIREAATWRDIGAHAHVAVNLSARNLLDPDLPGAVAAALERHGLPASRLVLEITETTMMTELDVVERVLSELRALGVQLSIDDFGTGYSSLTFLTRTAVNELKVDRTFIRKMMQSPSDAAIVRATIDLAHGLGLRAVAEGVEDAITLSALGELGCDVAQGFHLARPMPAEELRQRMLATPVTPLRVVGQRSAPSAERLTGTLF
jgi:diguanylate cyclase (GGDEF)-like protein